MELGQSSTEVLAKHILATAKQYHTICVRTNHKILNVWIHFIDQFEKAGRAWCYQEGNWICHSRLLDMLNEIPSSRHTAVKSVSNSLTSLRSPQNWKTKIAQQQISNVMNDDVITNLCCFNNLRESFIYVTFMKDSKSWTFTFTNTSK